ncbi:MAG TPA: arsenite S-adenosylmethyltransferase [Cyanobacteria bacterium UBA8530]|nr:arsenite S-adenosylmethyltransferase [Cyanobacteria bacterium UBA8530]
MTESQGESIRRSVKDHYAAVVRKGQGCCGGASCCSSNNSAQIGYSTEEISAVPEGADLGLGCGNPQIFSDLQSGETVLDLGSGAGFDCFLAARRVGTEGRVIGIDMTPDMVERARQNAEKGGLGNVEFRLGLIEEIPVEDASVDVILSNCVINLSPEKPRVFREAHRVLKPGGRLAISDIVAVRPLPEEVRTEMSLYSACISGAATVDEIRELLREAGFEDVEIKLMKESKEFVKDWAPGRGLEDYVSSSVIRARKPGRG